MARSDWEEYKEEPKPIFTETIEWFRPSDKIPELEVNLYFFTGNVMYHGKLTMRSNEQKKYFKNYKFDDHYSLIQVDAWAYAPNGGVNET